MKLDLKTSYKETIVPAMIKEFGYKNMEQIPKIVKISVNRGIGEAAKNSKELDLSVEELTQIVGQKPVVNKAKNLLQALKYETVCRLEHLLLFDRNKCITF